VDFGARDGDVVLAEALLARPSPGGHDSVDFSFEAPAGSTATELLARPKPGGADTVVLGGDDPCWEKSSSAHSARAVAAAPTPLRARLRPGGVDSVDLGGAADVVPAAEALKRRTAGGNSSVVLEDAGHCPAPGVQFRRPAGDQATWRGADRVQHAPGGASSLALGDEDALATSRAVSSNHFASGSNQNSGNFLTDRPSTRLHQAPGGTSSISLQDDSAGPPVGVSSSRFASATNQNSGNVLTDRPTTRVHHAPGGNSSLCLS